MRVCALEAGEPSASAGPDEAAERLQHLRVEACEMRHRLQPERGQPGQARRPDGG